MVYVRDFQDDQKLRTWLVDARANYTNDQAFYDWLDFYLGEGNEFCVNGKTYDYLQLVHVFKNSISTKMRSYKIWGGGRSEEDALVIWAEDMDTALFHIARKIDPKVNTSQWTGEEMDLADGGYTIMGVEA